MEYGERHLVGELSELVRGAEIMPGRGSLMLGLDKWLNALCIPLLELLEHS